MVTPSWFSSLRTAADSAGWLTLARGGGPAEVLFAVQGDEVLQLAEQDVAGHPLTLEPS